MNYRGTWLEINTEAISNNLKAIKDITGNRPILLPVKADAYGHGMTKTARFAEKSGLVSMFGVASIEEGISLRNAGITTPILILSYILPFEDQISALVKFDLMPTIGDIQTAQICNKSSARHNKIMKIHVKVDTGMGRLGCAVADYDSLCGDIVQLKNIFIEGLFTHMPVSDEVDNPFNDIQISEFSTLSQTVCTKLGRRPLIHMANSAAVLFYPKSYFDMVRPGIISYGYMPDPKLEHDPRLKQSMSLYSKIIMIKHVRKGTSLSYGHTYTTPEDCNIATIPCGYGDGYQRILSNNASVMINHRIYPVVGRICMDLLLVNCGTDFFKIGTDVELFGTNNVTIETVARNAGTIPYEITCTMALRIARIYK
jgi:alanine racemase